MTVQLIASTSALTQLYEGLSTDTKPTSNVVSYALFKEIDTGDVYEYSGTIWDAIVFKGASFFTGSALATGPIYENDTHKFFGEAIPGTALGDSAWRVSRMSLSTSQVEWADGNGDFDNVFTNLTTVEGFIYS